MNWYTPIRHSALFAAYLMLLTGVALATEQPVVDNPQTTYTMRDCVDLALRSSPRANSAGELMNTSFVHRAPGEGVGVSAFVLECRVAHDHHVRGDQLAPE